MRVPLSLESVINRLYGHFARMSSRWCPGFIWRDVAPKVSFWHGGMNRKCRQLGQVLWNRTKSSRATLYSEHW